MYYIGMIEFHPGQSNSKIPDSLINEGPELPVAEKISMRSEVREIAERVGA